MSVQAALPREETPFQRNHPSTSVSFVIPGAAQLKRRQSSRAPGTSAFVTSGSGVIFRIQNCPNSRQIVPFFDFSGGEPIDPVGNSP
ncbi:predicted protein [Coccidioides posadasii str. Silveira]|uniref:Predicted protein n=1 Tax=Coccidioides posadasii (strain RMSCC 757 / Silveira) TaxID=443226 RepID=E9D3S1_COCPS|nr:predicted protein [Coccidioides posadasii str. Silveira]